MSNAASGPSDKSSAEKAAEMPGEMSKATDKPASGTAKTPGGVSSGFKDPLPPGTDSKSGPGSDGPV